jgi:hypothetical protein
MRIPVSPFFTNRPNDFQVLNPATRVASGACDQMRRQLPKDYVIFRTMLMRDALIYRKVGVYCRCTLWRLT